MYQHAPNTYQHAPTAVMMPPSSSRNAGPYYNPHMPTNSALLFSNPAALPPYFAPYLASTHFASTKIEQKTAVTEEVVGNRPMTPSGGHRNVYHCTSPHQEKEVSVVADDQEESENSLSFHFHHFHEKTTMPTPRRRRHKTKRNPTDETHHCQSCGKSDTPEWRRGPDGFASLCNACGLRYAKVMKKMKEGEVKKEDAPPTKKDPNQKMSIQTLLN
eukprot:TRINITY_DN6194_c0_g1_i1.p1 TRINITY_DN6194_c0_g1~~TRINITY_DN6194_c0_g1_i1.p1  ORF type:complete len:216 (+),score=36.20 TRINITY_DN6194_c0_g1_i1:105-752(+)